MKLLKNSRGFSLMEIMIAVAIIGIFGGGAAVGVKKILDGAKVKRAKQDLRAIAAAVEQFEMDNAAYPNSLDELINDPGDLPDYQPGGYLKGDSLPKDPWKNEYIYERADAPEGMPFEILTYGADGNEGGDGIDKDVRLSEVE